MNRLIPAAALLIVTLAIPSSVAAHVVVTPKQVGAGAYQTFTTGVPNERDVPVTGMRLVIPDGIKSVTPTVKPGWTITTKKDGDTIREISWTGGNIPAGQRDDFTFSAQAPASPTTIHWKAYQAYQDGLTVAWDKSAETEDSEDSTSGPYSSTSVINDLNAPDQNAGRNTAPSQAGPYALAGLALFIAVIGLVFKRK